MSVNPLSVQVYREIEAEGLVSRLQMEVLRAIASSPEPITANEVGTACAIGQRTTFAPRVRELEVLGVVEKVGKRRCSVTGRPGHTFRMTGRRPSKPAKREPCPHCAGTGKAKADSNTIPTVFGP